MRGLLLAMLVATGCVEADATEPAPGAGDLAAFVAEAQPVLAARCANPSCHGNAERPLSLYAVHRHRLDPDDVYLDQPLGDVELRHNFAQSSVFLRDVSDAAHSLLLTKPLALTAGGSGHAGVEVFATTADHDYRRLRTWIEHTLAQGGDL